jgi:D-cysteine desulfhydrase family pyridoxal phosphate-dependent enzyme
VATALSTLLSLPAVSLAPEATPVQPLRRFAEALGGHPPRLFVKRDDLLSFALGGNKVRKLQMVAAEAKASGADALITCGAVQSNHARVTAAAGSALGMSVVLILNGRPVSNPTGNLLLSKLFGAEVRYVPSRADRAGAMEAAAEELRARGRRPMIIPLGASTPRGAIGIARAVAEVAASGVKPDLIVHSTSSGGTQAGLVAGCALFGVRTRVLGISADDLAVSVAGTISQLLYGIAAEIGASPSSVGVGTTIDVDDRFVGDGYGIPTGASLEATELLARTEGIVLDPVYTAKAMAGLIARIRAGEFDSSQTILFWHTGGTPGVFA